MQQGGDMGVILLEAAPGSCVPQGLHSEMFVWEHNGESMNFCHCDPFILDDSWMRWGRYIPPGLWDFLPSPIEWRYHSHWVDPIRREVLASVVAFQ